MLDETKLEAFRALVERETLERYRRDYPGFTVHNRQAVCTVKPGKRWTKVDVGDSGKYMVDQDGTILGIKAYGVPHPGHRYGTLDTIHDWYWGGYVAHRKAHEASR